MLISGLTSAIGMIDRVITETLPSQLYKGVTYCGKALTQKIKSIEKISSLASKISLPSVRTVRKKFHEREVLLNKKEYKKLEPSTFFSLPLTYSQRAFQLGVKEISLELHKQKLDPSKKQNLAEHFSNTIKLELENTNLNLSEKDSKTYLGTFQEEVQRTILSHINNLPQKQAEDFITEKCIKSLAAWTFRLCACHTIAGCFTPSPLQPFGTILISYVWSAALAYRAKKDLEKIDQPSYELLLPHDVQQKIVVIAKKILKKEDKDICIQNFRKNLNTLSLEEQLEQPSLSQKNAPLPDKTKRRSLKKHQPILDEPKVRTMITEELEKRLSQIPSSQKTLAPDLPSDKESSTAISDEEKDPNSANSASSNSNVENSQSSESEKEEAKPEEKTPPESSRIKKQPLINSTDKGET